jgi:hypothetical protein
MSSSFFDWHPCRQWRCLRVSVAATVAATAQSLTAPADLIIKNATVMRASHGTIQHGSVGCIAARSPALARQ